MKPRITVTGADERTPIAELVRLTQLSKRVEIGLLYSETPEGRNRYPSGPWLREAIAALGPRCAVHVCGSRARTVVSSSEWARLVGRVQFNGSVSVSELFYLCQPFGYRAVITQHNPIRNPDLCNANPSHNDTPRFRAAPHMLLVDASGGRGCSPEHWERPNTWKPVGFAGGLGPTNLAVELPRIAAVALDPWWVDMEGRLRTPDDWFSVALAEQAIEVFLETLP